MPGPANAKGRRKQQSKKERRARKKEADLSSPANPPKTAASAPTPPPPLVAYAFFRPTTTTTTYYSVPGGQEVGYEHPTYVQDAPEPVEREQEWRPDAYSDECQQPAYAEQDYPYIYDPGNGPRVRDFLAFLKSPFAASQSVPFDALGSEEEEEGRGVDEELTSANVIPLLSRILPGEFGAILWYNRTRRTHRVCPACRRIYSLGEHLKAHVEGLDAEAHSQNHQLSVAEQYLSGTCSIPCFALATYNYGPAAVLAYGLIWHQLDAETRQLLEGKGAGIDDQGLSLYIRISRCDGAGLRELLDGL